MTVGNRVKYYRKKFNLTSKQLSEVTGIHDTNIRKIETNKIPLSEENAKKLASAFGVSTLAITGNISDFTLETVGDMLGIVIFLIKNDILFINGERNGDNLISVETAYIHFTPMFDNIFSAKMHKQIGNLAEVMLQFKRQKYFEKLLEWEQFRYTLNELDKDDKLASSEIEDIRLKIQTAIECLELDMQSVNYILDNHNGTISIRNPQIINYDIKKELNLIDEAKLLLNKIKHRKV